MQRLRKGEGLLVRRADSLRVSAVVAEDDLNAYLWAKVDPSRRFQIRLTPEATRLEGSVKLLGRSIDLRMKGHFAVTGRALVEFVIDDVAVESVRLPRLIIDALTPRWTVQIDLANSPVPLQLKDVRVEEGRIFIYGQWPDSEDDAGAA